MQPQVYNATKSLQCSHKFTMQPKVYNAATSLQCSQNFPVQWLVKWLLLWLLLVMTYDITKAYIFVFLLYFQQFINESPFFFSQDYFPAVFSVFVSSWFINCFFHLVSNLFCNLLCYAVFLGPPFLLLLVSTLYIETRLLRWVAFNCFVLLSAVWVLPSLARATSLTPFCFTGFSNL